MVCVGLMIAGVWYLKRIETPATHPFDQTVRLLFALAWFATKWVIYYSLLLALFGLVIWAVFAIAGAVGAIPIAIIIGAFIISGSMQKGRA